MKRTKEKHGKTSTQTYNTWKHMHQRCGNLRDERYADYGARGIKVCARWNTYSLFLQDMGECPPGLSLDRIDNNQGYSPDNCRWATRAQQQRNRRCNRLVSYMGRTQCLAAWAKELGIHFNTLWKRLKQHSPEKAFTTKKFPTGWAARSSVPLPRKAVG